MSQVTCFHRILSHDVCKLVIEATRSSLHSVAGEAMGTGKNGTREGHHYFQAPVTQATSCRLIISLQTSFDKIRC